MDSLSPDTDWQNLFAILKTTMEEKGTEQLPGEVPISLTRKDAFGQYRKAYFNMDALLNRLIIRTQLYSQREELYLTLRESHQIDQHRREDIPYTSEQKIAEKTARNAIQQNNNEELEGVIEELRTEAASKVMSESTLENITRNARRHGANFMIYFNKLRPYIDPETLLEQLQERLQGNNNDKLRLTNYANAVIFWALADNHPFKILIREAFEENQRYTPQEIYDKLNPIFRNQHLGDLQNPSTAVKYLFITQRENSNQGAYYRITRLYAEEIQPALPNTYHIIDWFECNY